jgi:FkbM family methyltransferase
MIRPFDITIRDRKLSMLLDVEPGRLYSDDALSFYLDNRQVPEPELIHVLFRALKPGDLAVDAGANVGFFTVIMSKLVGPAGKVIAVEPDTRNLALLRKNLEINECTNVEIVERPLSNDEYQLPFYESVENGQSSLYLAADAGTHVGASALRLTTTLGAILGKRVPSLLKMDIEGSETEALQGLADFEDFIPVIVSEVNPEALKRADSSPRELIELLGDWGYAPFLLHAAGSLPSLIRQEQKIRVARQNTNMLFTMQKEIVNLWPEVEL